MKYFNGQVILIGDINFNITGVDYVDNEYLDILSEHGFRSFINVYTKISIGIRPSCLEHIFIKNLQRFNFRIEAGVVIQTSISDHFSTILSSEIENKEVIFKNSRYLSKSIILIHTSGYIVRRC